MSPFRKFIRKIIHYIKYPNQFWADFYTLLSLPKAKRLGISQFPPNYIYFDKFNEDSIIIDVGCGFLAEFSCSLIEKNKVKAFGVDPTLKHKPHLLKLEQKYNGKFIHVPVAVSTKNGTLTFNETLENESGSILSGHTNILKDTIRRYDVESVNLATLLNKLGLKAADMLKLDLEGAEFELLSNCTMDDLSPFKQLFIEFHHRAVREYSKKDTRRIVLKIKSFGFKSFSLDHVNYLFYK